MQLVDAIEEEIGPIGSCPSSILIILFAFDPHRTDAIALLTKLAAFSYGNNVPLNLACQFFAACSFLPLPLVRQSFQFRYDLFTHPLQSR